MNAKPLPSADLPEFADRFIFTLQEQQRISSSDEPQSGGIDFLIQQFDEDRQRYNQLTVPELIDIKLSLESTINEIKSGTNSSYNKMDLGFLNGQLSRANSYLRLKPQVPNVPDFETLKSNSDVVNLLFDIAGEYNPY